MRRPNDTMDPGQIQDPSQIPPPGAEFAGRSSSGNVDVYSGTLPGDTDAQPAAKELLGTALDTGGQSNADYIYSKVSALYGGVDLPPFQSPSGNSVRSLAFVSGSSQGGYGAFHLNGNSKSDFDRIVVDSLTSSGDYSADSGLRAALAPSPIRGAVFAPHRGASDLLSITDPGDTRLEGAGVAEIREAVGFAEQSVAALAAAVDTGNASAVPSGVRSIFRDHPHQEERRNLLRRLVLANQSILALTAATGRTGAARQYLSTALYAAEIVESFQTLTGKADPGRTDGEAVSRMIAFKLTPEITLIPGFNSAVTQKWWQNGQNDWVNDNSQDDRSAEGNGAGVMFLLFLNDYLGIPLDQILAAMPTSNGAPLGQTYEALANANQDLARIAGRDGRSAFQAMVALLQQNAQNPDGSLNLPADGNPFPAMPNARQGGLFAARQPAPPAPAPAPTGSLAQDAQAALALESQIEQQLSALKAVLTQIPGDVAGSPAPGIVHARAVLASKLAAARAGGPYGPNLSGAVVTHLEQEAAPFRAPQYDQSLQQEFWPHVYNELPGSGNHTDRLQVITGTNQAPVAVQITGTITGTAPQKDGDLHITLTPDDAGFPTNQSSAEAPLEVEIIYAGRVSQQDAEQAAQGYQNPFDVSTLGTGVRIQVAGPLIYDRAHGRPAVDGVDVDYGLEVHPVVGLTVLGPRGAPPGPPAPPAPPDTGGRQVAVDLASALSQAEALAQALTNLTTLLQKMQGEAPTS